MTDDKDTRIKSLEELIKTHDNILNLLAQALADHAIVIAALAKQCSTHKCVKLATWENIVDDVHFCDKCYSNNQFDVDDRWKELYYAKSIRFIDTHASLVSSVTVKKPQKPVDRNGFN
jgi:hypothetical protein